MLGPTSPCRASQPHFLRAPPFAHQAVMHSLTGERNTDRRARQPPWQGAITASPARRGAVPLHAVDLFFSTLHHSDRTTPMFTRRACILTAAAASVATLVFTAHLA